MRDMSSQRSYGLNIGHFIMERTGVNFGESIDFCVVLSIVKTMKTIKSVFTSFEKSYVGSRAKDIHVCTKCENVAKCQRCKCFMGVSGGMLP